MRLPDAPGPDEGDVAVRVEVGQRRELAQRGRIPALDPGEIEAVEGLGLAPGQPAQPQQRLDGGEPPLLREVGEGGGHGCHLPVAEVEVRGECRELLRPDGVSDAHAGLVAAAAEVFQGAAWQRCTVRLMRDCMREAGSWQLRRRVGRIVSQVFRGRDAATVTAMYHAACDMLEGCCPRAAAILEEAEPDALAYLDFPPTHWKRLRTNNVQERTNREIKRRSRVVQVFPSTGSLVRLAGAVMCEQDEIWQESRYFSEARMNELYDDGRTRGIDGTVDWARLEAEARKMLESGLELADRIETA